MSQGKPKVTIYTDGGADPNPGPGGWGVVLIHDATGRARELSGGEPHTTNNRMELTAAINALEALKEPCRVLLYADSSYVVRGMTEWIDKWVAKKWKRVENAELWQRLLAASRPHEVRWEWVKGHAGVRYNERADQLATQAIRAHYGATSGPAEQAEIEVYLLVSVRDGVGRWAASLRSEGDEQMITGYEAQTTANRLSIVAAAEALSVLPEGSRVHMYSQSDYLRNGATAWIKGWKRRKWLTKGGEPVKNRDVWEWLDSEQSARKVTWPDVKSDPSFEFAFEDVARRAQEAFDEEQARGAGSDH